MMKEGPEPEGVDLIMCKPVSLQELRNGIEEVISRYRDPDPEAAPAEELSTAEDPATPPEE